MGRAVTARRRATLVAAAVLALPLAACSGESPSPDAPSTTASVPTDAPIRIDTRPLAAGLLPADVADAATERVGRLLFSGLVRYDVKGKAVEEVASAITTDDDRVHHVTLEPGWTFGDGEPVTSRSFVDAWNQAARRETGAYRAEAFAPILGFDAVRAPGTASTGSGATPAPTLAGLTVQDETHFTITLEDPTPDFRERLGDLAFAPLPTAALRDPRGFAQAPVGNGPYRVDGRWDPAAPLRLRPRPRYSGEEPARNAGIDLRPYLSPEAAYADLEAGRLDVLDEVPTTRLASYRTDFGPRAHGQPVGAADALVFPVQRDPWRGEPGRLRRLAVSRAVDRKVLTSEVYAGTRLPATDLAAPVVEGSSQELCGDACRFDEDAAREALEKAGGLPGSLRVAYAADSGSRPAVDALCAQVTKALGVGCAGAPYPTEHALREAVALGRERGAHLETWRMNRPALAAFLVPRFVAGAPSNTSGYADDVVQTRLATAATAPLPAQPAAYAAIEADILTALPVVPLWSRSATGVFGPGVDPVRVDVFGSLVYAQITRP